MYICVEMSDLNVEIHRNTFVVKERICKLQYVISIEMKKYI